MATTQVTVNAEERAAPGADGPGTRVDFTRRAVWGVADQAASSLTNFALLALVAREVTTDAFGAFSVAFACYTAILGLSRAIAGDPLVVRYSTGDRQAWTRGAAAASGTALVFGIGSGAVLAIVGVAVGGMLRQVLLPLAAGMPGLLLQDAWRFAFVADRRPRSAFLNDALWALLLLVLAIAVMRAEGTSAPWLMAAWAGAGAIAAVVGWAQAGVAPRPASVRDWWRDHRDLIPRFAGEMAMVAVGLQAALVTVGAVAGLAVLGALRAAQVVIGPLSVIYMGAMFIAIPEGVRLLQRSERHLLRLAIVLSAGLGLVALAWGAVMSAVPANLGTSVLGPSWAPARQLFVPLTLWVACAGVTVGPIVALRALAAARDSFRCQLIALPLTFSGAVVGAHFGGADGAAWGLAAALFIEAIVWWTQARHALAAQLS